MAKKQKKPKKLWGARFKKEMDKDFEKFSKSIDYDYKLAEYDLYHSLIHVSALADQKLITKKDESKLITALKKILSDVRNKKFVFNKDAEDIHTDIQDKVNKLAGKVSLKLHTLRSRNDQVVFDEKLYCYSQAMAVFKLITDLLESLEYIANKYEKQCFVGFTHTQRAQIIAFSDYIWAYYSMIERDLLRVDSFLDRLFVSIGSGAMAGTVISNSSYAKAVKKHSFLLKEFEDVFERFFSSVDNVSDRDFIIELLNTISIIQMHLSRICEDMIIYSTKEFDFLDLPQEYCTGSSLMPHKKNPDLLELVRGATGLIYGNLVAVMTTMKALPLSYNRDMQFDKLPLFSSVDLIKDELSMMAKFVKGITLNKKNINKSLEDESLYATEIAEYLVTKSVAFKDAHDIVGRLVKFSEEKNIAIKDMPDKELKKFNKSLNAKVVKKIMSPDEVVKSRKSLLKG